MIFIGGRLFPQPESERVWSRKAAAAPESLGRRGTGWVVLWLMFPSTSSREIAAYALLQFRRLSEDRDIFRYILAVTSPFSFQRLKLILKAVTSPITTYYFSLTNSKQPEGLFGVEDLSILNSIFPHFSSVCEPYQTVTSCSIHGPTTRTGSKAAELRPSLMPG